MGWIVVCGVCACVGAYLGVYGVQKVFVCVWMCAACDTCIIFVVCVHMCLFMPVVCRACVHVCMGVWHAWGLCGIRGVCTWCVWYVFTCGVCSCVHKGEHGVAMVFLWCEWIYLHVFCIIMCVYICFCVCLCLCGAWYICGGGFIWDGCCTCVCLCVCDMCGMLAFVYGVCCAWCGVYAMWEVHMCVHVCVWCYSTCSSCVGVCGM